MNREGRSVTHFLGESPEEGELKAGKEGKGRKNNRTRARANEGQSSVRMGREWEWAMGHGMELRDLVGQGGPPAAVTLYALGGRPRELGDEAHWHWHPK